MVKIENKIGKNYLKKGLKLKLKKIYRCNCGGLDKVHPPVPYLLDQTQHQLEPGSTMPSAMPVSGGSESTTPVLTERSEAKIERGGSGTSKQSQKRSRHRI